MNLHIFREYDIRGVADRDLTDELARDLGRALGTFHKRAGRRHLALGRDCRLSSPRLHRELLGGLMETGMTVTDIGVGATPMMYFAVFQLDLEGGVQITGSHNPPEDNGFKMMKGKGSLVSSVFTNDPAVAAELVEVVAARAVDRRRGAQAEVGLV